MRRVRWSGAAVLGLAAVLAAGVVAGGGAAGKAALPKDAFAKLVAHDVKAVREGLARGKLDRKTSRKVRAAAFMVSLYAQAALDQGGPDAGGLTTLRDNALAVVKLVGEDKVKEAAVVAAKLTPDAKGAGGKAAAVAWEKQLTFEDVMHQFSGARVGGFEMEKELGDLGEGQAALTAAQLERLALLGYKMAVIGRVADAYADERNEGGQKTRANWLAFAEQFRKAARGLGQAARAKDQAGTRAALEKVGMTCTKCHDVFR